MEIRELLNFMEKEKVTTEELEDTVNDIQMEDIQIPSNLSVENTMAEINGISKRLYELHNNNKKDPMILHRIVSLLELKTKLLGMSNVKPEIQDIIDSEINVYKKRFFQLLIASLVKANQMFIADEIAKALTNEGL